MLPRKNEKGRKKWEKKEVEEKFSLDLLPPSFSSSTTLTLFFQNVPSKQSKHLSVYTWLLKPRPKGPFALCDKHYATGVSKIDHLFA